MKAPLGRPPKMIVEVAARIQETWLQTSEPGRRLPTERELAERFKVSRATVRGALASLERKKVLVRNPSAGRFTAYFPRVVSNFFRNQELGISFAQAFGAFRKTWPCEILDGISEELLSAQLNMMISPIQWSWMRNTKASTFFQASHISGLLLIGRHTPEVLAALKSLGKPIASVDADCSAQGLDSFCNDDYSAGLLLARRLNMLGHRRIAAVFESPDKPLERQDESWSLRRTGFAEGWSKTRNPPPRWIYVQSRGDRSETLPALNEMLRLPEGERPSAVVTAWGSLLGDLRAIAARNALAIPRHLTVMGFGGQDETPELTAVRFSGYDLGRRSAEHMIHTLCNRRPPAKKAEVTRIKGRYRAGETHGHHLA